MPGNARTFDWDAIFAEFRRQSGVTHREFCERRGISIHSFRQRLYAKPKDDAHAVGLPRAKAFPSSRTSDRPARNSSPARGAPSNVSPKRAPLTLGDLFKPVRVRESSPSSGSRVARSSEGHSQNDEALDHDSSPAPIELIYPDGRRLLVRSNINMELLHTILGHLDESLAEPRAC